MSPSSSVPSIKSIFAVATRFFSLKTRKNQHKERETDCFQSKAAREYEEDDESKLPDLLRTKLVLVFVFVLGSKALQFVLKNRSP